jgi:hypothetical protein
MTAGDFRALALGLPHASEGAHVDHPDFRVGGKIFATIWPDEACGMVKLTPEQQEQFIREEPAVFSPVKGAWGRRGATRVQIGEARESTLRKALTAAWRNTAPKRLARQLEER